MGLYSNNNANSAMVSQTGVVGERLEMGRGWGRGRWRGRGRGRGRGRWRGRGRHSIYILSPFHYGLHLPPFSFPSFHFVLVKVLIFLILAYRMFNCSTLLSKTSYILGTSYYEIEGERGRERMREIWIAYSFLSTFQYHWTWVSKYNSLFIPLYTSESSANNSIFSSIRYFFNFSF